jgi:hypothetical protein
MSDKLRRALAAKNKFDELEEKGYVRISAKTPEAKALERGAMEADAQKLKAAFSRGDDVVGRLRGKGKLGALAAGATLGYQALKGEPVMAQDIIKSGAELLNPLPFSLDEIKEETDKMNPKRKLDQLMVDKELERKLREEKAGPGALEFADRFSKALKSKKRF